MSRERPRENKKKKIDARKDMCNSNGSLWRGETGVQVVWEVREQSLLKPILFKIPKGI